MKLNDNQCPLLNHGPVCHTAFVGPLVSRVTDDPKAFSSGRMGERPVATQTLI